MKLRDWLDERDISNADFGDRIKRSAEAVRRYAAGNRIPDRETMPLIVAETDGAVRADDFFDLHAQPRVAMCGACERHADHAEIPSCTRTDCPMRVRDEHREAA